MWLRLADNEPPLVEVDLHGDPTGRAVVDLLVGSGLVAEPARRHLRMARTGMVVDVDRPLSELGLRNGDVLRGQIVTDATPVVSGPDLVVGMGPAAGLHRPLGTGLTVGREAEVRIDDQGLSREHVRFTVDGDRVLAQDLGSLNKTYLFGRPLDSPTPVPVDAPVEAASTILRVRPRAPWPAPDLPTQGGVALFHRAQRMPSPSEGTRHRIATPPGPRPPRRVPPVLVTLPLLAAGVLFALGQRTAAFAALGVAVLVALASAAEHRRAGVRAHRERSAAFRSSLDAARARLERDLPQETVRRWAAAPDLAEVLRRTEGPAPDLWDRRPGDADHLVVRVGWADLPSVSGYDLAPGGTPEEREYVARTLAPHLVVRGAPVTVALADVGGLALSGAREQTTALAGWVTVQLAALHSPRDLRLAAALAARSEWSWFAALPHAAGEEGPMLATVPDDARRLLTGLTTLVEERTAQPDPAAPAVVLVMDEELPLPRDALATILEQGARVGVHVVWLARHRSTIPATCRAVVTVAGPTVTVTWTDTGRAVEEASLDVVPRRPVETAAWNLAGIADATGLDPAAGGPTSQPSARLLGMGAPTPEEVLRRRDQGPASAAPVPLGPAGDIAIGSTVGGYLLKRQLGAGGMGAVYLARHRSLPRDVAIKVLHPAFSDHEQFRERFERESDVLCRLEHPNVVDVVDRGQDGDLLWMSMRYVPGPDLDTALRERGPFPPEQAVHVVAGVGRALDAAHAAGLLHRDVKPANILLRRGSDGSEEAMLTDFGIAKDLAAAVTLTRAGEAPATVAYAAPEQLEGLPIGRRADVYSLGAVLFELLTGRRAFPAADIGPLLASVLAGPVPDIRSVRPDLPPALADVVTTALQKDPADRFASCGELVLAAQAALVARTRAPRTTIGRAEMPPPPPAPRARPV